MRPGEQIIVSARSIGRIESECKQRDQDQENEKERFFCREKSSKGSMAIETSMRPVEKPDATADQRTFCLPDRSDVHAYNPCDYLSPDATACGVQHFP